MFYSLENPNYKEVPSIPILFNLEGKIDNVFGVNIPYSFIFASFV